MSNVLAKVNPKNTTQSAFLEEFLASRRTKKILPYVKNQSVLDFGCGEHLWTLKSLQGHASSLSGFDILYQGLGQQRTADGINVYGSLSQIDTPIDRVIALACFEHIEPEILPGILKELRDRTTEDAKIVGTVPRPPAKPVLEFLSLKLGLIDASQILDHKIYYDKQTLGEMVRRGGWKLTRYETFQFRMNSLFVLEKQV